MKVDGAVGGGTAVPITMDRSRVAEQRRAQVANWCVEVHAIEKISRSYGKCEGIFAIARARVLIVVSAVSRTVATLHSGASCFDGFNVCAESK